MAKKLFIAEKPSVAQEFAKALKYQMSRRDGYLESEEAIAPQLPNADRLKQAVLFNGRTKLFKRILCKYTAGLIRVGSDGVNWNARHLSLTHSKISAIPDVGALCLHFCHSIPDVSRETYVFLLSMASLYRKNAV